MAINKINLYNEGEKQSSFIINSYSLYIINLNNKET